MFNQTFIGYKDRQVELVASLQQDMSDQIDKVTRQLIQCQTEVLKSDTQLKNHSNTLQKMDVMCAQQA